MSFVLPAVMSGFLLSATLIIAIGAQNLFVLRQGLKREHVGPIVLFCGFADLALISAGVAGVGAFLTAIPQLVMAATLAGATFLGWYGVKALRRMAVPEAMAVGYAPGLTLRRALATTAAFTFLNPHVYLDTVLLMGMIGAARPVAMRPFFVLGAAIASFAWFAALGFGARLLRPIFAKPASWRVLDAGVGMIMLALSASLIYQALAQSVFHSYGFMKTLWMALQTK